MIELFRQTDERLYKQLLKLKKRQHYWFHKHDKKKVSQITTEMESINIVLSFDGFYERR